MNKKYIFITGGVVSSLGKGISVSSIARILIENGLNVQMQKFDPYINVDPGTLSPYQHGEVFVTTDGAETDLDQGHYERFSDSNLNKLSSVTTGKIYSEVISNERKGLYNGNTVQVIPHITDAIKDKINRLSSDCDVIICEVGGTIGDIESLPYIESIRQFINENDPEDTLFIHVTPIINMKMAGEPKTKPTQHSIKELRSLGINPDFLLVRSENSLSNEVIEKLSNTTNIRKENIFSAIDSENIYFVPTLLKEQGIEKQIYKKLDINPKKDTFSNWINFNNKIKSINENIDIAIVGKYVELKDAYFSVIESLRIAGYWSNININIIWISSSLSDEKINNELSNVSGIIVPGGFGNRGIEGKIAACKYGRLNNIPTLGICLGMQMMAVEFARNVLNLSDAHSTEFNSETKNKIIDIINENEDDIGGTLRLGEYETKFVRDTNISKFYDSDVAYERHRHRYEFNSEYINLFEKYGMKISGYDSKSNLVETIEISENNFYIGVQYHPEFTTRPYKPNPLFKSLIENAKKITRN